jgi:hypothetical protein
MIDMHVINLTPNQMYSKIGREKNGTGETLDLAKPAFVQLIQQKLLFVRVKVVR